MEPPLQPFGNQVDEVEVTVQGRPPRLRKVHAPPSFAAPDEVQVAAQERGSFLEVVRQGLGLEPLRSFATRPQDAPPGDGAAVVAHDRAHLPRTAGTEELGYVAIRDN